MEDNQPSEKPEPYQIYRVEHTGMGMNIPSFPGVWKAWYYTYTSKLARWLIVLGLDEISAYIAAQKVVDNRKRGIAKRMGQNK